MELGTIIDGRTLAYDEGSGAFEIAGAKVSQYEVRSLVEAGQLAWADPSYAEWFETKFPTQRAPARKNRNKTIGIVVAAVVLLACAFGSIASSNNKTPEPAPMVAATTGASSNTASSTPATEPTPAPVVEVAVPAPVTPQPAPAASVPYVVTATTSAYGSFAPITKKGKGDGVVKLPAGVEAATVKATHKGSSNFSIEAMDSGNDMTDLLVNTIGSYSGKTMYSEGSPAKLKVTADGPWTITIAPVSTAKVFAASADGKGDSVLLWDGGAVDWALKHSGKSNFAIKFIGTEGQDLLANDIGKYSGVVPTSEGPAVVIVTADGAWSIVQQ